MLTGRWLVDGSPQVILFDIGSAAWKLDEYKQTLWDTCNIGIPHLDVEANDAVILGYLISEFLSEVSIYLFVKIIKCNIGFMLIFTSYIIYKSLQPLVLIWKHRLSVSRI